MATNYNIRLKRYNGTDFDNLYPNTTVEQITGNWPTNRLSGDWPTNRLSGTINKSQITADATYTSANVTLSTEGWQDNSQTVSIPTSVGITSSSLVLISPNPNSFSVYGDAGIYCSAQATNSLTFTCDSPPSTDVTVNVVKLT